ncbi:MAG: NlpC/P60 family protein [Azospirillaceae bacterium]|nr:NlpC/P60 family protein [Azospirillaceae bacterium]
MSIKLDPRTNPFRADLAAESLRGVVVAARYAVGEPARVLRAWVPVCAAPDRDAMAISQMLFGEALTVFEWRDGWAWGQGVRDDYVGWVDAAALGEPGPAPDHRVVVTGAFRFPEPDLKAPPLDLLPFGALVTLAGERNGYAELVGGGWVYRRVLAARDAAAPDPVATARLFLGQPYLWGGRGGGGIDCSGLVQAAVMASGRFCPRDSDMQAATLGDAVAIDRPRCRGDLVFFPGHVGIMADAQRLIHANATHMQVVEEPLAAVLDRIADAGPGKPSRGIAVVRRL